MGVFAQYAGTILAADEAPAVIEGDWDREKVVLMSFPDESSFRAWANSPEYQEISVDRRAGIRRRRPARQGNRCAVVAAYRTTPRPDDSATDQTGAM